MGSRSVSSLLAAAACAVGLFWIWIVAFRTGWGARADERVFDAFSGPHSVPAVRIAFKVIDVGDAFGFAVGALLLVGLALFRRRPSLAVAAGVVLIGANSTTQILKVLTAEPRHPLFLPPEAWPSGHTTGFASLALCLVLVVPSRLAAPAAALGAASVLGMGWSLLLLGSHHPSDVLAAVLVAGLWAALAVAWLWRREETRGSVPSVPLLPGAVVFTAALAAGFVAIVAASLLLVMEPGPGVGGPDPAAAVAGVGAIAALSLVVVVLTAAGTRGLGGPRPSYKG